MNVKKLLAVTLAAGMLISNLTGCGNATEANSNDTKEQSKGEEPVILTVWGDPANQAVLEGPYKEINAAFEAAHPDIKIDYQWSGSFDNLNIATQSDSLPDIFWVQGNKSTKMEELAKNQYILNLDSYNLDASRYPQSAIDYATVDGSIYCNYPGFFDYTTVYYNTQIFDENGVKVPENFSEFENAVKTFAEKGITPIAGAGSGEFDRYWMIQTLAPVMCNSTLESIKNNETVDYSEMEKMLDTFRMYSENQYFGKDFQATDLGGAQLAFANGKTAMIVDGTWNNVIYRELPFKAGAFAMPDEAGVRYGQSGESNFTTNAVSSKTKYPNQAVEYLKFLSSKDAEQIMEDHTGSVPLTDDINPKDDMVKQFADVDEIGLNIYHVLSGASDESGKPQDIFLGEVVPKLMTGEIDGAQGIELIQKEIEKSAR